MNKNSLYLHIIIVLHIDLIYVVGNNQMSEDTKLNNTKHSTKQEWREWFTQTRLYKIYKVISSKPVTGALIITTSALAVAGVGFFASPFGAPVAAAFASFAIGSVLGRVIVDTFQSRKFEATKKENNLLVKNRDAKNQQIQILKDNPELQSALKDQLFQPKRDAKKSLITKSRKESKVTPETTGIAFLGSLDTASSVTATVLKGISGLFQGPFGIISGIANSIGAAYAFATMREDFKNQNDITKIKSKFEKFINLERGKEDTPSYNDLSDLRKQVNEQNIQTKALEQLARENYSSMSQEDIKIRFSKIKNDLRSLEVKADKTALAKAWSIFSKGQNPYSKINNPANVEIKRPRANSTPEQTKQAPAFADPAISAAVQDLKASQTYYPPEDSNPRHSRRAVQIARSRTRSP